MSPLLHVHIMSVLSGLSNFNPSSPLSIQKKSSPFQVVVAAMWQSPLSCFGTIAGLPRLRPHTTVVQQKKNTLSHETNENKREKGERGGSERIWVGIPGMPMARRSWRRGGGGPGVVVTMPMELAAADVLQKILV